MSSAVHVFIENRFVEDSALAGCDSLSLAPGHLLVGLELGEHVRNVLVLPAYSRDPYTKASVRRQFLFSGCISFRGLFRREQVERAPCAFDLSVYRIGEYSLGYKALRFFVVRPEFKTPGDSVLV